MKLLYQMNIGKDVRISYRAQLDKSINPQGILDNCLWALSGAMFLLMIIVME